MLPKPSLATAGCITATTVTSSRPGVQISSFLIKVASRCNLACDYCYMYQHADQAWRKQPSIMARETREAVAKRIGEYVSQNHIPEICVVFHGGEPLLAGAQVIADTATWIRRLLPGGTKSSFSLQTNGTLLTDETIRVFLDADIGVSISLDGDERANDLHRLDHAGRSTYDASLAGLMLLERSPRIFSGIISVVDPKTDPEELFAFFSSRRPPRWDFLLPDAHHDRLPPGREADPALYERWLIRAFDLWFDKYPELPVRTFEALVGACLGMPSQTDAFGFGDPSLLTIETDGSYHDLDVLKITRNGFTSLGRDVWSGSIDEASRSEGLARHASLLRLEGLSEQCQLCPENGVCGGGAVPHRYSDANELNNPTVYCQEMRALIAHIRRRLRAALEATPPAHTSAITDSLPNGLADWERAETSETSVQCLVADLAAELVPRWEHLLQNIRVREPSLRNSADDLLALDYEQKAKHVVNPAVRLWITVRSAIDAGTIVRSTSGTVLQAHADDIEVQLATVAARNTAKYPRIHETDARLRAPFDGDVLFEQGESALIGENLARAALDMICDWSPALLAEIQGISPDIQFVVDPHAGPDSVVSFSDDSVPGCLYISIRTQNRMLDAPLIADSIIHEHRHQKLYLLQRKVPLLINDSPLIESPWRNDPRPPSGLFHALFVFVPLLEFWQHLEKTSKDLAFIERARKDVHSIAAKLERGFAVIRTTQLTDAGRELIDLLEGSFRNSFCA